MSGIYLVLYATREGQTRKIAEYVGSAIRSLDAEADVIDAARLQDGLDLKSYDGAILAASLHMGRHEPEMVRFARQRRADLNELPTAFLSVSAAQVGAEDPTANPADRQRNAAEVRKATDRFVHDTGWMPARVLPVAGALKMKSYGLLIRLMMRIILRMEHARVDPGEDSEFTNWVALNRWVQEWIEALRRDADGRSRRESAGPSPPGGGHVTTGVAHSS